MLFLSPGGERKFLQIAGKLWCQEESESQMEKLSCEARCLRTFRDEDTGPLGYQFTLALDTAFMGKSNFLITLGRRPGLLPDQPNARRYPRDRRVRDE